MFVRTWLPWLVYPTLTLGAVVGAWLLMEKAGVPLAWAVVAVTLAGAVFVIALERWLPYSREWQRSQGDLPADAGHLIASNAATEGLRLLATGPLVAVAAWLTRV